jgi:hypothetical protein
MWADQTEFGVLRDDVLSSSRWQPGTAKNARRILGLVEVFGPGDQRACRHPIDEIDEGQRALNEAQRDHALLTTLGVVEKATDVGLPALHTLSGR